MAKAHAPTDKDRKTVEMMAAFGIPQEAIAKVIGCGPKALRREYKNEISRAAPLANAKVAQSLFQNATERNNVTAQIFWLKCRGGDTWREKGIMVHQLPPVETFDVRRLTREQLDELERILRSGAQIIEASATVNGDRREVPSKPLALHPAGMADRASDN